MVCRLKQYAPDMILPSDTGRIYCPSEVLVEIVRAVARWSESQWERLRKAETSQGGLKLHILENAGHWLHADNPEGLRRLLADNLLV